MCSREIWRNKANFIKLVENKEHVPRYNLTIRDGGAELLVEAKLTNSMSTEVKNEYLVIPRQEVQFGQGTGFMKKNESQKGGLEIGHGALVVCQWLHFFHGQ